LREGRLSHDLHWQALDTIGCADPLVALGEKAERFGFLDGKSYLSPTDFTLLAPYTRFPFSLVIPQSNTEAILVEQLGTAGINIWRPYKAVSMGPSENQSNAMDVRFESGEVIQAEYVIGADGAKSVVSRSSL
jgi:2-polyprenyl-6-methoxyphenol hydroxylase-like FAD-dependent oxidoreductase